MILINSFVSKFLNKLLNHNFILQHIKWPDAAWKMDNTIILLNFIIIIISFKKW